MLIYLADYISIIPLAIMLYLIYTSIRYNKGQLLLILFIATSFITQLFKTIPYPIIYNQYTQRPKLACNCDYISFNGNVGGNCGMPSGHMSTITFFSTFMAYKTKNYYYLFLIPATAWARYYKNCHNFIQIFLGSLLGIMVSGISILKKI